MYGAPAFAEAERAAIEERFGVRVISGFGMSETTFGLIEDPYGERRPASMGKARQHPDPAFVNEARVVDDDGREVSPGQAGELIISNPAIMRGYFDDPETDGRVAPRRLALDRRSRAPRRGRLLLLRRPQEGHRAPAGRERLLGGGRGRPHGPSRGRGGGGGRRPLRARPRRRCSRSCSSSPGPAPSRRELASWCRERLADFKVPRYIQLVPELPKTSTGKLQKGTLRDELADPAAWWDAEAS